MSQRTRQYKQAKAEGSLSIVTLSIDIGAGDAPPTEFRLFVGGWNDTEQGKFLFDDRAAKSVMSAYREWGVDLAIDLEHGMLDVPPGAPDPTARDARGWCQLELRADGSLWAVNVRWTPDGARRLAEKTQRYVSPAFKSDAKTKRILKMFNVAMTATPATHDTPALVAASANGNRMLDIETVKKALEAIAEGDDAAATEILKSMIASAASGEPAGGGDADGSEGDGADGVAPPKVSKEAVIDPKVVAASDEPDDDDDPKKKTENKAMRAMLCRLTGAKSFAEALVEVENFRTSHLTLETGRRQLAAERATLESAERRKLVTELVTLGAEFPATVWADDKATAIKKRWLDMPIAELRAHVGEQRLARAKKPAAAGGVQPDETPTNGGAPVAALSASELEICKQMNCDPQDYAALKAIRDSGKKAGN